MARQPKMITVTGSKGSGKSYRTLLELLTKYINKRRILIIDVNDEYGDYELEGQEINIPIIALSDVKRFSTHPTIEARRVVLRNTDGTDMDSKEIETTLIYVMKNFENGALLVEDLNTVFGDSLPDGVSATMCNNRQRKVDIFIALQSLARVVPKIRQNSNIYRIHRQFDPIENSEGKMGGEYEIIKIAYYIVEKHYMDGDKYFYLYIDKADWKIKGNYTPKELAESINDYLSSSTKALRPLLNRKDKHGKKVYGFEEAMKIKTQELMKKYGG